MKPLIMNIFKLCPFYLSMVLLGCLHAADKKIDLINKAKLKYEYFGEFLEKNALDEKEILIVLDFMEDPEKHFDRIKAGRINPNKTFLLFDRLGVTDAEFKDYSYKKFLDNQFSIKKNTDKKTGIITFMMSRTDGYLGEILSKYYVDIFAAEIEKCMAILSVQNDAEWQRVASGASLNWLTFKPLVEKLADDGFKGKFKRYVLFEQFDLKNKNGVSSKDPNRN